MIYEKKIIQGNSNILFLFFYFWVETCYFVYCTKSDGLVFCKISMQVSMKLHAKTTRIILQIAERGLFT